MKRYGRVLLKLSGETLAAPGTGGGIDAGSLENVAGELKKALATGVEIAVVIGAGNLWRGAGKHIERVTADDMGMLATVMNSLALRDVLEKSGVRAKVFSAVAMPRVAELYVRDGALSCLSSGTVAILAGGTGNPYFTTDTTAALRAVELKADVILKATQVDGVYDADPKKDPAAKKFARLSFDEAIRRDLKVMDTAAFALCRENGMPIIVFDFHRKGNVRKAVSGAKLGTFVS